MSAVAQPVSGISRREFLYYIWGASIALYLAEFAGLIIWFAIPRIPEGTFGGVIRVDATRLPDVNAAPLDEAAGRFWLVNLDTTNSQGSERMYKASDEPQPIMGITAIYKVCTHLGCIYAWNPATDRFECPCHGSKYRLDGRRIQSPAPRNLDRFPVEAVNINDETIARSEVVDTIVQPLMISESDLAAVTEFKVDTGQRVSGNVQTLLQDLTGGP
jgi:cytochrome b6-f complex iron-sulfur subunit